MKTLTRKTPLASDVDLDVIARHERCACFSGADLCNLVREASFAAIRPFLLSQQKVESSPVVTLDNFMMALSRVEPSVSKKDQRVYDRMQAKMRGSRGVKINKEDENVSNAVE